MGEKRGFQKKVLVRMWNLLTRLLGEESVHADDLAEQLELTPNGIRTSYFRPLEELGLIRYVSDNNSTVALNTPSSKWRDPFVNTPMWYRLLTDTDLKSALARYAVQKNMPTDPKTIAIDSGSWPVFCAREIFLDPRLGSVSLLTPNLQVAIDYYRLHSTNAVILTGGRINFSTGSLVGDEPSPFVVATESDWAVFSFSSLGKGGFRNRERPSTKIKRDLIKTLRGGRRGCIIGQREKIGRGLAGVSVIPVSDFKKSTDDLHVIIQGTQIIQKERQFCHVKYLEDNGFRIHYVKHPKSRSEEDISADRMRMLLDAMVCFSSMVSLVLLICQI